MVLALRLMGEIPGFGNSCFMPDFPRHHYVHLASSILGREMQYQSKTMFTGWNCLQQLEENHYLQLSKVCSWACYLQVVNLEVVKI